MSVINSNSAAMITANSLNKNDREMNGIMERLSTGKRINSSADDAAGLAIATKMTAQIRGLDQAGRNANNATSMLQLADGAAEQVSNILQRMREITVQASDGSNSTADIAIINVEFVEAAKEIDRIVNVTQFNGKKLLNGDAGAVGSSTVSFQIGANKGETLDVKFGDFNLKDGVGDGTVASINLGSTTGMTFDTTKDIVFTAPDGASKTTITAAEMATAGVSLASNAVEVSLLANKKFQTEGVDLNLTVVPAVAQAFGTDFTDTLVSNTDLATEFKDTTTGTPLTLTISATDMTTIKTVSALAEHINTSAPAGFTLTASVSDDATPKLVLTLKTPHVGAGTPSAPTSKIGIAAATTLTQSVAAVEQSLALESAGFGDHTTWASPPNGVNNITNGSTSFVAASTANGSAGGPMGADISAFITSGMGAALSTTLAQLDVAIEGVATQRATFGATMNRLTSVVDNLASAAEATSTARGRIEDANYASETTALARSQIISQAGTAMLAQANQKAQSVLSLLQ
jgi:flagellin